MAKIKIEIGGKEFTDFKSVSVTRRLDTLCGEFSIIASSSLNFNIINNLPCKIFISNGTVNHLVLTGYIEKLSPSIDPENHDIEITGRDISADLVDSSIPASLNIKGGITLTDIIKRVISGLGLSINVKNNISGLAPFTSTEIISAEPDQNAFDLINQYASKRSVLLTSDYNSNIIITRAGSTRSADKLINYKQDTKGFNNIKEASASYDNSQRYNKYTVISQDNLSGSGASIDVNSINIKGSAYDNDIRKSRQIIIQADNASDSKTCAEIATFEANIRRANSLNYNCMVQGFFKSNNELWATNELIQVTDEDNFISSELLIKACTFTFNDNGSNTQMELALRDAYTIQANLDKIKSRSNKTGNSNTSLSDAEVSTLLGGD